MVTVVLRQVFGLGFLMATLAGTASLAVPAGVLLEAAGTQSDVEWAHLESEHFRVYHDEKARAYAREVILGAEDAWDDLSTIWDIRLAGEKAERTHESRYEKIPFVLSTRTNAGGFANFATMNVEVQTATGSSRSLIHHELVHRLNYEYLDPGLGPAGRAFTLTMVPSWWLEGVAEYLTESVGRLETRGVARTMALRNAWPSWDTMHALYHAPTGASYKGYVSSGRFVRYLMGLRPDLDLVTVHRDYFWKTLTPPFVNASPRFVRRFWEKSDVDKWGDFKAAEAAYWQEEVAGLPPLLSDKSQRFLSSSYARQIYLTSGQLVYSSLHGDPWPSALEVIDLKSRSAQRNPLNLEGNALFAVVNGKQGGELWTVQRVRLNNAVTAHNLAVARFRGPLAEVSKKSLESSVTIPTSTSADPVLIMDLRAGDTGVLALGSVRGETILFAADAVTRKVSPWKRWTPTTSVKILGVVPGASLCAVLLIDDDHEQTHIERHCSDGQATTLVESGRVIIRDGVVRPDGSLVLLVGWGELLGLIEWRDGGVARRAVFPEWVSEIESWDSDGSTIGAWVFNGYGQELHRVSPDEIWERYEEWTKGGERPAKWLTLAEGERFLPPWKVEAERLRKRGAVAQQLTPEGAAEKTTSKTNKGGTKRHVWTRGDAPYRSFHLFTYPYGAIPGLGGWSLGVFSVPLMDEMERYRVAVAATYNFETEEPSASVEYANFRVWDGLTVTGSYAPRFNGYYYLNVYDESSADEGVRRVGYWNRYPDDEYYSYVNMLREISLTTSLTKRLSPTSLTLVGSATLARLEPGDERRMSSRESAYVGAQTVPVLGTAMLGASVNLADWAFYLGDDNKPGGTYLRWVTSVSSRFSASHSLGQNPLSATGQAEPEVNFRRSVLSARSSLSFDDHDLSFRGLLSSTWGPQPLHLREYYQPYQTYLIGSSQGLNNLNYSILGEGSLFSISQGEHSFKTSCDYSFPVWNHIDWKFLIAYLDNIRGEVVVAHGGIARERSFKDVHARTSASVAGRMTIDIKGFKLFPSVAYGQIIGRRDWAFFSELSFSEFF